MERKANFANEFVGNIDAGSVVGRGGGVKKIESILEVSTF